MDRFFRLTIENNIARLVFDYPNEKVNKLSVAALEELGEILQELASKSELKALILSSAKEGVFIAGADIKNFDKLILNEEAVKLAISTGHRVLNQLEKLPFPSIAAINGACLGGGLELALACTYRIVGDHPKTQLGLPETTIGIFPGFGGTQRLPRLIGFTQGVTMVLTGKSLDAKKAFKAKLADAVYLSAFFEEGIEDFLGRILSKEGKKAVLQRRKPQGVYYWLFEANPLGRWVVSWMALRELLKKTKGFYPSPIAALHLLKKTYSLPLDAGLKKEEEAFIESAKKGDFRYLPNLLFLFFTSEAIKKDPGAAVSHETLQPIQSGGVLGSGTMGGGIAGLMSQFDIPVRLKDINWELLGGGLRAIYENYQTLIKLGKWNKNQVAMKMHRVSLTQDYKGFDRLDLVIEAAIENKNLKHEIFKELEANVRQDTIIATNTSSYTIKELVEVFKHPERFLGMHFFNPPSRMPLVEVIAGEKTSPEVIARAVEFCKKLKKTPIVVRDCTGFLVNRIFVRGFSEIIRILEEGAQIEQIERVVLKFGMPMAPFVLADEVGNDVNLKVFESLSKAYPDRIQVPEILKVLNQEKLLGKKTGSGFYLHQKKTKEINPRIKELLKPDPHGEVISDSLIIERLLLSMIHEASLCLEENIVKSAEYLDLAMVYGIGFPPFRGGVLHYADHLGIDALVHRLSEFEQLYGARFSPNECLLEMKKHHKTFL